jgi:gibberellin 2beta-dioxygenase
VHGDVGELEYLILLHTDPDAVAAKAKAIDTDDPSRFRYA